MLPTLGLPGTRTYIKLTLHFRPCFPKLSLPATRTFIKTRAALEIVLPALGLPAAWACKCQTCAALGIVLPQTHPACNLYSYQTRAALKIVLPTLGLPGTWTFIKLALHSKLCAHTRPACPRTRTYIKLTLHFRSCFPKLSLPATRTFMKTHTALQIVLPRNLACLQLRLISNSRCTRTCAAHTRPA